MVIRNGSISGALGIGILVSGLLLGLPHEAPAPPISAVQVVNTPADPVPTAAQGTTLVGGNVAVTNDFTNPIGVRDADNPAKQPFQVQVNGSFTGDTVNLFFTVPPGKQLVIEQVTATIGDVDAGPHTFNVLTTAGGTQVLHQMNTTEVGQFANGLRGAVVSQQVRLYADPQTQVRLQANRNVTTGPGGAFVGVSGYLVNLP